MTGRPPMYRKQPNILPPIFQAAALLPEIGPASPHEFENITTENGTSVGIVGMVGCVHKAEVNERREFVNAGAAEPGVVTGEALVLVGTKRSYTSPCRIVQAAFGLGRMRFHVRPRLQFKEACVPDE